MKKFIIVIMFLLFATLCYSQEMSLEVQMDALAAEYNRLAEEGRLITRKLEIIKRQREVAAGYAKLKNEISDGVPGVVEQRDDLIEK